MAQKKKVKHGRTTEKREHQAGDLLHPSINGSPNKMSELCTVELADEKEKRSLLAWVETCLKHEPVHDHLESMPKRVSNDGVRSDHNRRKSTGLCIQHDVNSDLENSDRMDVDANRDGRSISAGYPVHCTDKTKHCVAGNVSVSVSKRTLLNEGNSQGKKRKKEADKVVQYVMKRRIMLSSPVFSAKLKTINVTIMAWGKYIPVTVTSEASVVEKWISEQNGNLFGLDVEWKPNRQKGQKNKAAVLQLCGEKECLIIQLLYLDWKPPLLSSLLSDPEKHLAGVGVLADGCRLFNDHGLECQGTIELTTLAVERLKREELRHVSLRVLVQEVLGLEMDKKKSITLSNWAKQCLNYAQVEYACMDAWASFALSQKLLSR